MVKLVNSEPFLSQISKLGERLKQQPIIRLTIKRGELQSQYPELLKRMKHKNRNELLSKIKEDQQSEKHVPVLFRVSSNQATAKTFKTQINEKQITTFSDKLSNVFRLWCFQVAQDARAGKKQMRRPTAPEPKSKRQAILALKKIRNKERRRRRNQLGRLNKKESQRQKTFATKRKQKEEKMVLEQKLDH